MQCVSVYTCVLAYTLHTYCYRIFIILKVLNHFFTQVYAQNNFAHYFLHTARMFHRHHKSFQQLWQKYLTTGVARRQKRLLITARKDTHLRLPYTGAALGNCGEYVSTILRQQRHGP